MRQIVENVYRISLWFGYLNIYVIDTGDGLAVIDTGASQNASDHIIRGITSIGCKPGDIKQIFITHAHYDHTGGLYMLQKQTQATTYAHRREAMIIRGEQDVNYANRADLRGLAWMMHPMLQETAGDPARVDSTLHEGDNIMPGIVVVELPGHSYGHIGFWWPERKLLFGGDVLFNYPWGLRMPFAAATPDWQAAKDSVQRVATLKPETLLLGHGAPIVRDAAPQIIAFANGL